MILYKKRKQTKIELVARPGRRLLETQTLSVIMGRGKPRGGARGGRGGGDRSRRNQRRDESGLEEDFSRYGHQLNFLSLLFMKKIFDLSE